MLYHSKHGNLHILSFWRQMKWDESTNEYKKQTFSISSPIFKMAPRLTLDLSCVFEQFKSSVIHILTVS